MRNRISILFLVGSLAAQTGLFAQGRGGGRGGPPQPPKAAAPIDVTGYWVSVVSEDWRYRMVTPAPGDFQGVPMTQAAVKVADTWDPDKEEASGDRCKSYGAPALLRVPERLHITWQDDQTLKLETDAGKQTRTFHFGAWKAPEGPHTLQGDSVAAWESLGRGGRGTPANGSLKVTTTHLKGGFLRKNGVPYSDNTELTEYYDLVKERNGDQLLVVTIVTTDPMYLRTPFIISSQFKKQASDAGWSPSECSAKW
ncbi:MAG TPA: hypothetical protein VHY84_18105 [Bryobacteraceae bacterium]|jgi:hypothetical protein|nr:hypothetical protein [Bryobacteraceae bacterium]